MTALSSKAALGQKQTSVKGAERLESQQLFCAKPRIISDTPARLAQSALSLLKVNVDVFDLRELV